MMATGNKNNVLFLNMRRKYIRNCCINFDVNCVSDPTGMEVQQKER